jgi:hypothetical protein
MAAMTPAEAVTFLAKRVAEQARVEGNPFSAVEERVLRWSEVIPGLEHSPDLMDQFDATYDSDEYESKVARLLKTARQSDSQAGSDSQWQEALTALRDQDAYILVMCEHARVEAPRRKGDQLKLLLAGIGVAILMVFGVATFAPYRDRLEHLADQVTDREKLVAYFSLIGATLIAAWLWRRWWNRKMDHLGGK